MEVRFTIKGQSFETTFSPVRDGDDIYLYSIGTEGGGEFKFLLEINPDNKVFKLQDYSVFEEDKSVIEERLLGLSGEWMESDANGFDSDAADDSSDTKPGYSPDDIYVENKPFSLRQLVDLIDVGDLELGSDFQRNFVWDNTRQSRLIESIFLGLPLPSIYLSQYDDGTLTIVDGLQRLTTIRRFLKDELILSNLEYLEECNGKKYSQLPQVLSSLRLRRFGQTQIMCFVIDYRSPAKLKYDLFRRLNTGGKPLNNQEIRNCLSRPVLQNALKVMVTSDSFLRATDHSVKDTRMDAQESALRFMYFLDQYSEDNPVGTYSGNMDNTLDGYVESMNRRKDFHSYITSFKQSMEDAFVLFGRYAFRKVGRYYTYDRRSQVNKLLMMSVCVLLAKYRERYKGAIGRGVILTEHFARLIENNDNFFNAITWSTNSKSNIEYVFRTIKSELFDNFLTEE